MWQVLWYATQIKCVGQKHSLCLLPRVSTNDSSHQCPSLGSAETAKVGWDGGLYTTRQYVQEGAKKVWNQILWILNNDKWNIKKNKEKFVNTRAFIWAMSIYLGYPDQELKRMWDSFQNLEQVMSYSKCTRNVRVL